MGRVGPVSVSIVVCVPSLPILSQCAQADSCFPRNIDHPFHCHALPLHSYVLAVMNGKRREGRNTSPNKA